MNPLICCVVITNLSAQSQRKCDEVLPITKWEVLTGVNLYAVAVCILRTILFLHSKMHHDVMNCVFFFLRLQVEKLKELGIPPGPMYGKLKKGEPISLPDGIIVCIIVVKVLCCTTATLRIVVL